MAIINLDYYKEKNETVYTDGEIEKELLEIAKDSNYDWLLDGRWPIVYHLSHIRENILNWYPFKKNSVILEIGSGCGALTSMLCKKAARVIAVELTLQRTKINYERNKEFNNLELIVSDVNDLQFNESFDYIIVNGVLEYAELLIKEQKPHEEFLKKISTWLAPRGTILLSIENRIGLKYLSGSVEDHTGEFFSGINNYCKNESVRTFTKKELITLIKNAGLYPLKFYYPYPDYKFPTEIFTDTTINSFTPHSINISMDTSRLELFNTESFYDTLKSEQINDKFANSFLVEINNKIDSKVNSYDYIKISANRKKEFQICTIISFCHNMVYKKALHSECNEHLNNMVKYSGMERNHLSNILCKQEPEKLCFEYIKTNSLEKKLLAVTNKEDFCKLLNHFKDALYNENKIKYLELSKDFTVIFGEYPCPQPLRWIANGNIDLIAGNIFIKDDMEYEIIDYEWQLPCNSPLEFSFWRMLDQLVNEHDLHDICTVQDMCIMTGINYDTLTIFKNWNQHFIENYVGIKDFSVLAKDVISIQLKTVLQRAIRESKLYSSLFWDCGDGFSEANLLNVQIQYMDSLFVAAFKTDKIKDCIKLRWDPFEGNACIIKIEKIDTDAYIKQIAPINSEDSKLTEQNLFYTYDPQYIIVGNFVNMTYINIYFKCEIIDWTKGYDTREKEILLKDQTIFKSNKILAKLQKETDDIKNEYQKLDNKISESNNLNLALLENIAKLEKNYDTLKIENSNLTLNNDSLLQNLDCLNSEKQYLEKELDILHNTKWWKVMNKCNSSIKKIQSLHRRK